MGIRWYLLTAGVLCSARAGATGMGLVVATGIRAANRTRIARMARRVRPPADAPQS